MEATGAEAPAFVAELPPKRRPGSRRGTETPRARALNAYVEELKRQPGLWARWKNVRTISSRSTEAIRARGVECAHRVQEDGTTDIYVRWPEEAEAAS